MRFLLRKLKNHICETLAYNCPVNSWRVQLHRWRGVNIGKNVFVGLRCTLDHAYPEYIYLEDDVGLAGDDYILTHTNPPINMKDILESYVAPVIIKKGTWVGIKATILPNVTISENSIIGAGVVLSKSVLKNSIVVLDKNKIIQYDKKQ